MSMRNSTRIRKSLVNFDVSRQIRRRTQFPLDNASGHVRDDDILRRHRVIRDATRLDGNEALVASDAAGVTESVEHQAAADELKVRIQHFLPQDLQQHRLGTFWPGAAWVSTVNVFS